MIEGEMALSDEKKRDYMKLISIINSLQYGEIIIKKEAGKIVLVKEVKSIKLSE